MQTKAVSTIKVASTDKSPANRRRTQVKAVSKVIRSRVTAASTAAKTRSPASRRRTQVRAVSKAIPSQVNRLKVNSRDFGYVLRKPGLGRAFFDAATRREFNPSARRFQFFRRDASALTGSDLCGYQTGT